jgi:HPt (histidine-containing phosphotransfer) domain-containing protein
MLIPSQPGNRATAHSRHSVEGVWAPPAYLVDALSNDAGLLGDLLNAFDLDTAARIARARAALEDFDFRTMQVEAHAIKGGARQVGADSLADACQELESVSASRDVWGASRSLDRVRGRFEKVRRAMFGYSLVHSRDPAAGPLI